MGITSKSVWIAAAAVWALAEATFFFIVPDVLLTVAVLVLGYSAAVRLSLFAAAAAAIGGTIIFAWAHADPEAATTFVGAVPLIGEDLFERVAGEINGAWPLHLMLGAVTGVPYKVYAVEAGANGVSATVFIMVSFVARFTRFLLAVSLAAAAFALARRTGLDAMRGPGLVIAWSALYAAYTAYRLSIS